MPDLTPQITDEQREQLLRSIANVTAAFHQFAQACVPIVQAAGEQFAQMSKALQEAGYLDQDGKPASKIHIHVQSDPPHVAESIRDLRRFGTLPRRP